jgi:soluble lytic murein transglycosylase-like protein
MAEDFDAARTLAAEAARARADGPGVGLRHPEEERRTHERRSTSRKAPDRRRGERRRRRTRTLLLAAATLASSTHARIRPLIAVGGVIGAAALARSKPHSSVAVTMEDFRPIPAHKAYDHIIQEAAAKYNLDPDLIRAVMRAESAFNPHAVSRVGAQGLMQLMPALAAEMGVQDPFDPYQNVMAGARYLRELLDAHRGNLPLTLASYNAGPGNVKRYKGIPPFRETRDYVKKITNLLKEAATDQ